MKRLIPKISVVIPAYNEEVLLPGCLDSVFNQEYDKRLYEVIVVDNASTDKTGQIARDRETRVVKENKKGYVFALIAGIKTSQGEIVAITDADCRVPVNWLIKIWRKFNENPQLVGYGGAITYFDGGFFFKKILSFVIKYLLCFMPGGNMAFRRKAFEKIGGFDPNINLQADVFLYLKLRRLGKIMIDRRNAVATSSRRYRINAVKSIVLYSANFLFLVLFHRPLFFDFPDIREKINCAKISLWKG